MAPQTETSGQAEGERKGTAFRAGLHRVGHGGGATDVRLVKFDS